MILITDIDNVLSDASWRQDLLPDWDAYHRASADDKPHENIIQLINAAFCYGHGITVAITGRPEKWEQLTNEWLIKHGINLVAMYMRRSDDYSKSPEMKLRMVREIEREFNDPHIIILEDREDITTVLRDAGFTVLQVHNGKNSR